MQRGALDYMALKLLYSVAHDGEDMLSYPITSAVDVYSFGLVLWHVVTGAVLDKAKGTLRTPMWPFCSCLQHSPSSQP